MGTVSRHFISRHKRVFGQPAKFNNYVQYSKTEGAGLGAQFADVSATGMRLISRQPNTTKIGDVLNVEFTLPGTETTINSHVCVVRTSGDFEFAVRFLNQGAQHKQELHQAVAQYFNYVQFASMIESFQAMRTWMHEHRQGLILSLVGMMIAISVGAYVHFNSDEYQGRALRSWGSEYPKQWDMDYVKKFN